MSKTRTHCRYRYHYGNWSTTSLIKALELLPFLNRCQYFIGIRKTKFHGMSIQTEISCKSEIFINGTQFAGF